jgi:hypothetical protein
MDVHCGVVPEQVPEVGGLSWIMLNKVMLAKARFDLGNADRASRDELPGFPRDVTASAGKAVDGDVMPPGLLGQELREWPRVLADDL